MNRRRLFAATGLALALAACAHDPAPVPGDASAPAALPAEGRSFVLEVAGQRAPCTGVAPMLCLQVRTQPDAAWQYHYGEIEGFDWQVGVESVIRVREFAVENPPADGSSRRWVLEEVLERRPPG
jgi:hypothetical protein